MQKTILQVVADGKAGGGTTAVLGLCEDMLKQKKTLALITEPNSYLQEQAEKLGIRVYPLDMMSSRFNPKTPQKLAQLIQEINPSLLHLHGGRAGHIGVSNPVHKLKIPTVYTVHGYHFLNKSLPLKILGYLAEYRISRRVACIATVSKADEAIARNLNLLPHIAIHKTIYNGVNPTEFTHIKPLENQAFDLVFMARLHRQKNPLFVLDVLQHLPGKTLLMVGGGELEAAVHEKAQALSLTNRITFKGALPRQQALRALVSARVNILPSLWEGLPIAPIEAMFCGLPIVASDIPGTDEVVANNQTGFLLKEFNSQAYAERIEELLSNPQLHTRFSQASKKRGQSLFSRQANSDAYLSLYASLLAGK